ncbi:MAG TPA: tail-specific protease [Gammaproteobacteria bacterium]|jgi:carboxyl-terminal processing protease|nr:tail-specific protease [Gammaproteobacteria bacterium]HIK76938.1 tail-specific protease [Gammaproteobacteria bacterium]
MIKKFKLLLISIFLISSQVGSQNSDRIPALLTEKPVDNYLLKLVTAISERAHISQKNVNNESSIKILNSFIKSLDSFKMYFTEDDITYFQRYRYKIDDTLKSGDLDPIFDMFSIYRLRVQQRLSYSINLVNSINSFDAEETYEFRTKKKAWSKTNKTLDNQWRKKTKNDLLSLVLAGQELESAKATLKKRYQRSLERVNDYEEEDVINIFLNSYMDNLDPHSNYLTPSQAEEYEIQTSLSYQGIGARLQNNDDFIEIVNLMPGGPAEKNGLLKPLDKIIGIYDKKNLLIDVIGWDVNEVVKLIRGPKGSTVKLKILPTSSDADSNPYDLSLIRDDITLEEQAASSYIKTLDIDNKQFHIGVITVPSFYQDFAARRRGDKDYKSTASDVKKIVEELEEVGIDAIVMDLRGNSGGLLDEATALTGLFIDNGPIVQLKDMDNNVEILDDPYPGMVYNGPMVIMIDRYSASASEIFAGAIQDYQRGIVIGQKTFGKGTVQNLYPLDRYSRYQSKKGFGQLTLTIAKYYRVTGSGTQNKGVIPDIELPSFINEEVIGEETKSNTLPWDQIVKLDFKTQHELSSALSVVEDSFLSRKENNLALKFLIEDINDFNDDQQVSTVSLNIDQRKNDRNSRDLQNKERRKKRLKELGYTDDQSFDDFRSNTILNEIYLMVADLIESWDTNNINQVPEKTS